MSKTAQGGSNYYVDVIYRGSEYIYWMDHNSSGSNWGTDTTSAYTAVNVPTYTTLASGTDDFAVTAGEVEIAWDKMSKKEDKKITFYEIFCNQSLATDFSPLFYFSFLIFDYL